MSKTTEELKEYKKLLDDGVITKTEFETQKARLLKHSTVRDKTNTERIVLKNRFSENERMDRKEYLIACGAVMLIFLMSIILDYMAIDTRSDLLYFFELVFIVAAIGIHVITSTKRFHDINTSGWAYLLFLIPLFGGVTQLYLLFAIPVD